MKHKYAGGALIVLAVFFLAFPPTVPAQEAPAQPQVLHNPHVHPAVQFDVSPPLSEMATEVVPESLEIEAPVRHPKLDLLKAAAQSGRRPPKEGALQTSIGAPVNAAIGLNLLGVGKGFPAYSVPDAPPDVNLAVGDTQVVQWVNVSYAIFNKSTGAIVAGPIQGNAFWNGFGGPCQNDNSGDILPQWDKIAHRWVMSQNVFVSGQYTSCFAISTTANATGTYYRFAFLQPGFPDYPKLGIMPDAYYQSQNNFGPAGTSYVGAYVCAYERAKMLVGNSTAKQICFQTGTFDDSLLPADLDSAGTLPPAGQPEVFLGSIDNGSNYVNVYEYLFHVDFTTPSNSTFTGPGGTMPVPGVASFSLACGGFSACVKQPTPGELLDSLGDRLMYRLAYRNFSGDHQTWLVSHSVTAGTSVGERWYEMRAPENATNLSVYQQGTFAPDSSYRWMGSVAMDQSQNIALGYSVSSSSVYPAINFTGREPGDPLGTMAGESLIVAGTGSQQSTSHRWGDYTSMVLDAQDDCTFWYTAEYYQTTASFGWSTRLASFKFPSCGGTPTPDFSITASPSSQSVLSSGGSAGYSLALTSANSYSGSVTLSTSALPSGVTAGFSPNPVPVPSSGIATSTLTLTVAPGTAAGSYPVTVTGTDGTLTHSIQLTLLVQNFTISASPSSVTVTQGSPATFTATITPQNGFNGVVTFSASGLPPNSTASFSPTTVTGSGSTTLTVTTDSTTATGTFTVTITGTSGGLVHYTTVSLTVNSAAAGDFTISAAPSSRTVKRGSSTTYSVTVGATGGFSGSVALSISGLPARTSASFSPNTISGSGTSTLSIKVNKPVKVGTYPLTITGTSSSGYHSTTVTLVVN
jgi:hypothetical protein